jgi:hypothetical protein
VYPLLHIGIAVASTAGTTTATPKTVAATTNARRITAASLPWRIPYVADDRLITNSLTAITTRTPPIGRPRLGTTGCIAMSQGEQLANPRTTTTVLWQQL